MMSVSKPIRVDPIRVNPIRQFEKYISELRRRVAQGDASAICDLGMWLQEGSQDRKGRSNLRSNPAYTFRLLKAAAVGGYEEAAAVLRQLASEEVVEPCRCRRFIIKTLRGHAVCAIHPKRTGHQRSAGH